MVQIPGFGCVPRHVDTSILRYSSTRNDVGGGFLSVLIFLVVKNIASMVTVLYPELSLPPRPLRPLRFITSLL